MQTEQPEGPPTPGGPDFLVIGRLHRSHGIRGEIILEVLTDFPERIQPGAQFYLGDERLPLEVQSRRVHGDSLLVSFRDYVTPEAVSGFRNQYLYVPAADRPPLPEGEYYYHQLLGLQVVADTGQPLGVLVNILDNPANEIYVVRPPDGPEILLPAIEDVILGVDLQRGEIHVHVLPGLI
jgi:16S rRNA processing protein RimM